MCASCSTINSDGDVIKKFPIDNLDVFKPLIPEDSLDISLTYMGIPIAQATDSFATKNSDIYINLHIVILDQHPKITSNLLSFAMYNLSDMGFTNSPDSILSEKFDAAWFNDKTPQEALNLFSNVVSKEFYEELPTILTYECGFNMDIEIYPVFLNDEYVTYCKYAYYYTGGAHGNYSRVLQTYNLKTGDSVDLEDIIKSDKMTDFRRVVVDHMAASYPIFRDIKTVNEYLDSLNSWKGYTKVGVALGSVPPNQIEKITVENYPINVPAITEVGLVICYEKYFLTPGINGCPTIVISYDEIRDCLKPPFNQYQSIIPQPSPN